MAIIVEMFQVHANTAHAEHAAVGEEARQALKGELANEYQLYHYIRFVSILVLIIFQVCQYLTYLVFIILPGLSVHQNLSFDQVCRYISIDHCETQPPASIG